jgi:hypothetical protein
MSVIKIAGRPGRFHDKIAKVMILDFAQTGRSDAFSLIWINFIGNFFSANRVKEFDSAPMTLHIGNEREVEKRRNRIVEN